jgi:aconitate decarboxylase
MGLTAEAGSFVSTLRYEEIPEAARAVVRLGVVDCMGVMAHGWGQPVTALAACGIGLVPARSGVAIDIFVAPAPERALICSIAAHAIDFDDTGLAGHPSAVLVPAIMSEAVETGADGRQVLTAYVAGYEVWAELLRREADSHHRKGWHPTAVFGAVAAAAASAKLRGHDRDMVSRAIGVAASLAGGIVGNFGSMTKPFQVGRAAQSGLLATRLAEAGLTSADTAIEDKLGFLQAISPHGNVDRTSPSTLGKEWLITRSGINIKLYPVCYAAHRAVDAAIDVRGASGFDADNVESIQVHLGVSQAEMLRVHRPQNSADARFSGEFAVSAALLSGGCGPNEVTDEFVRRPQVQKLISQVRIEATAERDTTEPAQSPFDFVEVKLKGGSMLVSPKVRRARGHYDRGIEKSDLWRKFSACVSPQMDDSSASELFETLQRVDDLSSVSGVLSKAVPNYGIRRV